MNEASPHLGPQADPRSERLQPWIAALLSALLHVLMLLALLHDPKPTFTTPQGAGQRRAD